MKKFLYNAKYKAPESKAKEKMPEDFQIQTLFSPIKSHWESFNFRFDFLTQSLNKVNSQRKFPAEIAHDKGSLQRKLVNKKLDAILGKVFVVLS